jgi:hypothetical protein
MDYPGSAKGSLGMKMVGAIVGIAILAVIVFLVALLVIHWIGL